MQGSGSADQRDRAGSGRGSDERRGTRSVGRAEQRVRPADAGAQGAHREGAAIALTHHRLPGDGINDAPAIRAADIGISVDSAVDIAKEAADIILLEKSLLVLEQGVRKGGARSPTY